MSKKIKHDCSFKKSVVKEVTSKGLSSHAVGLKYSLCESIVQRWVSFYKTHRVKWLKPIRNSYSPKFKAKVIIEMRKNSLPFQETWVCFKNSVCRKFDEVGKNLRSGRARRFINRKQRKI